MPDMLRPIKNPTSVSSANTPRLVWAARLDQRYEIEVQRPEGSDTLYKALLLIFDIEQQGCPCIHAEEVDLAFGARNGPDPSDVSTWQDIGIKIADSNQASDAGGTIAPSNTEESTST